MDGSYGNVFPTSRAMSPSIPAPSGSDQYKINVNRQKTRKWANFKPQNYDGDDWGSEYDEPPYEPEPPPPPKPMGPRSPAAHSPVARPFQPTGSPHLRTQTQQQPAPPSIRSGHPETFSGSPSFADAPPRRSTEPIGPQPQKAPGRPHQGPTSESPRPWVNTRSESPQSAKPLASPDKPLPFIRPADVYRRMEEEKEKERRSLETVDPAPDNATGRSATYSAPGADPQPRRAQEVTSSGTASVVAGVNDTLPPAAERKSEDGFDGLLASYGTAEQQQMKSAESQKSVQPMFHEELRRFSTSPQLPDLTRMSGFGEDLFSSTLFPPPGLRSPVSGSMQLPTTYELAPESGEAAGAAPPDQSSTGSTAQNAAPRSQAYAGLSTGASEPVSTVKAGTDAALSPLPQRDQNAPVGLPRHQEGSSVTQPGLDTPKAQPAAADAEGEMASSPTVSHPSATAPRPSLPGGWVTETPSNPDEAPVSDVATDPVDKAARFEAVPSDVKDDVLLEPAASHPVRSRQSQCEEVRDAGAADAAQTGSPSSSRSVSRDPLPSPPTMTPALSTKPDTSSRQDTQAETSDPTPSPSAAARATLSNSPTPTDAAHQPSEITPTPPLNPQRGTPEANSRADQNRSAQSFEAESDSPVKDSDVLREEILKSLSPVQPTEDIAHGPEASTAAYRAAADAARESSYLGDVYGDYWTSTNEKTEPGPSATGGDGEPAIAAKQQPLPGPVDPPTDHADGSAITQDPSAPSAPPGIATVKAPEPQNQSRGRDDGSRRRFSWEAALDTSTPVAVSLPATKYFLEQKSLGSGADNMALPDTKPGVSEVGASQLSKGSEGGKSAEDLRAESAPEVDTGAPLASTSASDSRTGRESPPTASAIGERDGGSKRLSLAEEKILLQETSTPVSPSPPLEQHPAFAGDQVPRPGELASAPPSRHIVGFREIMEMPSPAERIRNYSEARWQFSAVDTGLDEWLRNMMSRHPEHANAVLSYSGPTPLTRQSSQGAAQTAQAGGRSPAHLHMAQIQHGLSGLGHSGNQMGTKGKEFLMAAGKAGKGLLSKGRSKLRGTGDKVFSGS